MSEGGSETTDYPGLLRAFTTQFRTNTLAGHSHLGAMTDGSPRLARRHERFVHERGYWQIEIDVVGAQYTLVPMRPPAFQAHHLPLGTVVKEALLRRALRLPMAHGPTLRTEG